MRALALLTAIGCCLVSFSTPAENSYEQATKLQGTIFNHGLKGFGKLYEVHGQALRMEGMLMACSQDALAADVRLDSPTILNASFSYMKTSGADMQSLAIEIAAAVESATRAFVIGFADSFRATELNSDANRERVCKAVTTAANNFLAAKTAGVQEWVEPQG